MAQPVIAIGTSHGPQLVTEPSDWPLRVIADKRNSHYHRGRLYSFDELVALRADLDWAPQITPEVWQRKHGECQDAIAALADRFRAARPDVAIIFGNDQSEIFNDRFLDMIAHAPTQAFGYAQLGQENSFGWDAMRKAYPMQMEKLAQARSKGRLVVETMGETGRRFKRAFRSTPTQAQIMLQDPFGHTDMPQRTVWYQSKYLRANLHFRDNQFYLRDLHVYDDRFAQPYLTEPVRQHGIEQRLLAVLDGYHWSDDDARGNRGGHRAMGRFVLIGADGRETPLTMNGLPTVTEKGAELRTSVPLEGGGNVKAVFREKEIEFRVEDAPSNSRLALEFEWVANRSALQSVSTDRLNYSFRDFPYSVRIAHGTATRTDQGVKIVADPHGALRLHLAQSSGSRS